MKRAVHTPPDGPEALASALVGSALPDDDDAPALGAAPAPPPPRQAGDDPDPGNALQVYLRDIRRTPLLTPEEEFSTALAARAGDFAARQSMIEHNLPGDLMPIHGHLNNKSRKKLL
jgi:RNA polymerase nonessential primary-like sigma factor